MDAPCSAAAFSSHEDREAARRVRAEKPMGLSHRVPGPRGGVRLRGLCEERAGQGRFQRVPEGSVPGPCWAPQPHRWNLRGMYLTGGKWCPAMRCPCSFILFPSSALLYKQVTLPTVLRFASFSSPAGDARSHEGEDPFPPCNETRSPNQEHPDLPILHQDILKQHLHFFLKGNSNFFVASQHIPKLASS